MATHSSVLAWRIPGTGEPGGGVYGVAQSQTRVKQLSSSSIDLENKYKLEQGTLRNGTDPTLPTTAPEKYLDIFLL